MSPVIRDLRSDYADVAGHRLHYWFGGPGDGPLVVLFHGFLGTAYAWRDVAPALIDAGCRVLAADMLGYGDSDKPAGVDGYDARAVAQQIRVLAERVAPGAGERILVGHDMGAPAALIWAADHPDEIDAVVYIEEPTLVGDLIRSIIDYTPQAMSQGSMWWWLLPLAPGVPEALIVGNEQAFLRWFYDGASGSRETFDDALVEEYLRSFSGPEGVLGSMGVYRAAFTSIDQTEDLQSNKLSVPVVGVGGTKGLGASVADMLTSVARNVTAKTLDGVGHFVPEQAPRQVVEIVLDLVHHDTPTDDTPTKETTT